MSELGLCESPFAAVVATILRFASLTPFYLNGYLGTYGAEHQEWTSGSACT
jgi:hypothetical protein